MGVFFGTKGLGQVEKDPSPHGPKSSSDTLSLVWPLLLLRQLRSISTIDVADLPTVQDCLGRRRKTLGDEANGVVSLNSHAIISGRAVKKIPASKTWFCEVHVTPEKEKKNNP